MQQFDGTTVVLVRDRKKVVIASDGQVSYGNSVLKGNAKKVRLLFNNQVMAGFAGSTADAFSLLERFEVKLQAYHGNLLRAAVELAKDWRTDKVLRRLEALLLVADKKASLMITGNGDVIEPENAGIMAIGSGGLYAQSAALALLENTTLGAREIAKKSLTIAADLCVFTNHHFSFEEMDVE